MTSFTFPKSIQQFSAGLVIGEPVRFQNLTMYPLISPNVPTGGKDYLLLDEALASGTLVIHEISEAGSVPNLLAKVFGDSDVLLLDGEELIGEKQNRTLNLSVLAPANSETLIPVSCVEAGRWNRQSRGFSSSDRMHFSKGRTAKMRSVSENLSSFGSRESDQRRVWDDIEMKLESVAAFSQTSAMADAFESNHDRIEPFVENVAPQAGQIGAVFMVNDQFRTVEILDRADTFARILPKLVRSIAIDAIEEFPDRAGNTDTASTDDSIKAQIKELIANALSASAKAFPAAGKGEDIRLMTPNIEAGALVLENRLLHLTGSFTEH